MPDFDDLDVYFTDFSVEITLHEAAGDRVIDALFSNEKMGAYRVKELNSPDPPFALVKTEDVPGLDPDCPVTIDGDDYNILNILPDGTGFTNILLEQKYDATR